MPNLTIPDLAGKAVLITGASQGIGAAIAKAFAAEIRGVRLALVARNVRNIVLLRPVNSMVVCPTSPAASDAPCTISPLSTIPPPIPVPRVMPTK